MTDQPHEITRTVAIEHAGEKISIEVHVHLTAEEIRRVVVPAIINAIRGQVRCERVRYTSTVGSSTTVGGVIL